MTTPMKRLYLCIAVLGFAAMLAACSRDESKTEGVPEDAEINPMYSQKADMMERALADDPRNVSILIELGNLYYDWGQEEVKKKANTAQPVDKWSKGVDCYRRALDIKPDNANVRVDMGSLLQFMGKSDEAIAEFRQAKKMNPKHPQARINLVLALGQEKQDYKGAITEYDELIKAIPDQVNNMELKAEVERFRQLMKGPVK